MSVTMLDHTLQAPFPFSDWSRKPAGSNKTAGALMAPYSKEGGTMYGLGEVAMNSSISVEFNPDASLHIQNNEDGTKQYNYYNYSTTDKAKADFSAKQDEINTTALGTTTVNPMLENASPFFFNAPNRPPTWKWILLLLVCILLVVALASNKL